MLAARFRNTSIEHTSAMQLVNIHKILAPTDFSQHSNKALGYARTLAEQWGAELHLLNVIEPTVFPTEGGLAPMGLMNLDNELTDVAQHSMEELCKHPELAGVKIVTATVHGRASSAIIDYAAEHGIDLVVIATHGRTGLEHLIFGSTAERVIRECPCPVLTIRDPDKKK